MMSNPFYSALTGNGMPGSFQQMVQQLKNNPIQFLAQRRLNIPAGMGNDPNAIINHLLTTGQFNQEQLNRAYLMARNFKI